MNAHAETVDAEVANGHGEIGPCSRCRFWRRLDGDDLGECRRRPPVVVPIFDDVTSSWPITEPDEWCGEWRPVGGGRSR